MIYISPTRLQHAVAAICPEIEQRATKSIAPASEAQMWWELSCCLLSSQVSYNLAAAAADALERSELLLSTQIDSELSSDIEFVLKHRIQLNGRTSVHRFYKSKAIQLASTKRAIIDAARSLKALLAQFDDAASARNWLVSHAPGIGPKQASMFLRNVGWTYELAIIDRHVVKYMQALGISPSTQASVSALSGYKQHEQSLQRHAKGLGFSVGLLDWAIWIVMRTADKLDSMGENK